jgi:arginine/lysine/ornithine decarboxylase
MEICLEEYENINFIIDEAWGAINYFHPFFKKFTAMEAVKYFSKKGIKVSIISFQSGHKSLSVLRQGSFINVYTCDSIIKDIEKSIFKIHTTSPNYSILALASLETKGSKQRGQIYLFLYSRLRLTAFQTENK